MRQLKRVILYGLVQHLGSVTIYVLKCIQRLKCLKCLSSAQLKKSFGEMAKAPHDRNGRERKTHTPLLRIICHTELSL